MYAFSKTLKKNVSSWKLKAFQHSHLESRFATPETTMTVPNYRVEKIFFEFIKSKFSENFLKK